MGRIKVSTLLKKYVKGLVPVKITVNNVHLESSDLLRNRVAIVTGGSRGIGKAAAIAMIESGATVVALGRNRKNLEETKNEINNVNYIPYCCDVSDVDSIGNHIDNIQKKIGDKKISILVNCAGIKNGNDERFFEFQPDEFEKVIDTNLKGMFFWCQQIAKYMINNHIQGNIVNVTSIKGVIGEASPYSVSKWGATSLTKGLARLLAPKGIIVNGLAPGGTATDMAKFNQGQTMVHMATPSLRLATPEEMGNIITYLASDLGRNVVGQIIIADGGQILQYGNDLC